MDVQTVFILFYIMIMYGKNKIQHKKHKGTQYYI